MGGIFPAPSVINAVGRGIPLVRARRRADRVEQFLMNPAEAAVRHDHHDVALAQIGRDVFDDGVGAFYREPRLPAARRSAITSSIDNWSSAASLNDSKIGAITT